jgi:hypothetical protein
MTRNGATWMICLVIGVVSAICQGIWLSVLIALPIAVTLFLVDRDKQRL